MRCGTPTWNVSGAWNIDNESFESAPVLNGLDALKLRATYGISGNLPNASALLNLQADATIRPTDVGAGIDH